MMKEPGVSVKAEKITEIDSIKSIIRFYFEDYADILFLVSESDVDLSGEVITRTAGVGELKFDNERLSFPCKIIIIEQGRFQVSVQILVGDPRDVLCLELFFKDQKNGVVQISSDVRKRNSTHHDSLLPKGVGIHVYGLIPKLLTNLAKVNNKEYVHTIHRSVSMEKEVWLQTFNQFIIDNAYQYTPLVTEDTWVKSYV